MDDTEEREEGIRNHPGPIKERTVAPWVRTEELMCELWNAIAEDFSQPLDEVADYDDEEDPLNSAEEYADEEELRESLFRQLADLRPGLGDLLSGSQFPVES